MGAQNTRQAQAGFERTGNGNTKKALSRRASTGALITRQERMEYSRRSVAVTTTNTGTMEIATGKTKSSTLSSASSVGCLLTNQDRAVKTDAEDTASQSTESSETARSLTISRSGSGEAKMPGNKLPLAKRNSKSLSARIAPTLKKLAKRSSKTVGAGSSSSIQVATSKLSGREEVASEFLSLRSNEQQRQHHIVEDGDLGAEISKTVEWNGTTLRKSWFNDDHNSSNASLGRASAASVAASAESRADSVADVRQQRSASLSSRQCRRAASVGSLLGQSSTLQQPGNSSSIDELISTASSTISTLSLTSNGVGGGGGGGGGMTVRQRCSSQASHAFSTNTNPSRRSSSSSSSLALQSTQSCYSGHQQQQPQQQQQQQGYSRQNSLQSTSSAFTPQSHVSALNGRSTSRSHSRSSVGTGRFSSPSCSPPLTRAPTKLELLLGFSRCAVARCPGIGARYEDVELWVRGTDRALIKSGWQEQPFLCTGNLVLVYGVFLVALQTETIRTVSDLRGIILTCLYIAFTYGGHEISYPLKPFLYTTDRSLFWDRCIRIALSSSSLMLQINKKEPLYHDLLISLHDELYTG